MADFSKIGGKKITRRDFILEASSLAGVCLLNCESSAAQQTETPNLVKALEDKNVITEKVRFKSGNDQIDAYLSRPKRKGRFPVVVVVAGNSIEEEYIRNTTAMLAQKDFVGIAPNIYSLQKQTMTAEEKTKVFAEQITDERIFTDIQAAIDYLKTRDFAKKKRIGITGFCFGGRCALMFAAQSKEIKAVAPFYGNLRTPPFAKRQKDPPDVADKIKAPVQGHYARADTKIPLEQLNGFEESLKKRGARVEIFTYEAPHGFFAYTRRTYNAEASQVSWQRTVDFFKKNLSG